MENLLENSAQNLSGGELQRLAIALALAQYSLKLVIIKH